MSYGKRLLIVFSLLMTACASLPTDYPRESSTATTGFVNSKLGHLVAAREAQNPGLSGFGIVRYGRPAFTARVAFSELAEKTLDVQYYIWEADSSGQILALRLIEAADRGVRVRLLLDDITLAGRDSTTGCASTPSGQGSDEVLIDDIRIFDRALSDGEVQALYYEGGWAP